MTMAVSTQQQQPTSTLTQNSFVTLSTMTTPSTTTSSTTTTSTAKKQFHITSFFQVQQFATPDERRKAIFAAEEAREAKCDLLLILLISIV
jgi:hypothetical protein